MKRFECLQAIAPLVKNELFVTSAGGATSEWNAVRPSDGNIQVKTLGLHVWRIKVDPRHHVYLRDDAHHSGGLDLQTSERSGTRPLVHEVH